MMEVGNLKGMGGPHNNISLGLNESKSHFGARQASDMNAISSCAILVPLFHTPRMLEASHDFDTRACSALVGGQAFGQLQAAR